ncbi:tetratricopeptide repeat protein [Lysobacter sp. S4-A87]|uniref:tetratricopeptide repeat protein n=1 Tax=Lysobacter sp. S4-A87 TaxID=2925843 RepID=UPI001F53CAAD|nr:tetratricopeptide repeat protein [Lysobacter sp. S4-A87]UNK49533.1 tetratricopeptide repeat protein [Lysobacter sp. S4-A87]
MFTWVIAATLALATPAPTAADATPPAQIMALPAELQSRYQDEVLNGHPSQHARLERTVDFMFGEQGLGMTYKEDATATVSQAYATREANCLTFTLLFLALAREAGLDATPQEIEQTLAWHQEEGTLYRSNHINASVRIGGRMYSVDVARDAVIARHPPQPITQARLIAHFYNNLGIAALERLDLVQAQRDLALATELDPGYANHWSNAGVIAVRSGNSQAAERAYDQALTLDPDNTNALFNMAGLAHRHGDAQREADYRRRLARLQQKDPFHHFLLAVNHERAGEYPLAIRHYRQAIRLYGDEHRFYSALARAYLGAGDTKRAAKALVRAQALSDGDTRAAYRAKLDSLQP